MNICGIYYSLEYFNINIFFQHIFTNLVLFQCQFSDEIYSFNLINFKLNGNLLFYEFSACFGIKQKSIWLDFWSEMYRQIKFTGYCKIQNENEAQKDGCWKREGKKMEVAEWREKEKLKRIMSCETVGN